MCCKFAKVFDLIAARRNVFQFLIMFLIRCFSPVGRQYLKKGMQELSIGKGCNSKGIILHELMHALGFWHEQSRSDRQSYLEVLWEASQEQSSFVFHSARFDRPFIGIKIRNNVIDTKKRKGAMEPSPNAKRFSRFSKNSSNATEDRQKGSSAEQTRLSLVIPDR